MTVTRVASRTWRPVTHKSAPAEVGFPVRVSRGLKILLPLLLLAYGFGSGDQSFANWLESAGCVALLLGSVAIHEFGHVVVVQRLGLTVKSVTLTAFGGLTHYEGTPAVADVRGTRRLRRTACQCAVCGGPPRGPIGGGRKRCRQRTRRRLDLWSWHQRPDHTDQSPAVPDSRWRACARLGMANRLTAARAARSPRTRRRGVNVVHASRRSAMRSVIGSSRNPRSKLLAPWLAR